MNKRFLFFNMSYQQVQHLPGVLYSILFIPIGYVGMHWHKEMELLLVLKGNVSIQNSRFSCMAETGDLFWINGSEMHGLLEGDKDNLLLVLQIDPGVLNGITGEPLGDRYQINPRFPLPEEAARTIRRAMAEIMMMTGRMSPGYSWFSSARLLSILGTIRCSAPETNEDDRSVNRSPRDTDYRIKKIIDFLNTRYRYPVTLEELADSFQLSTYYLSHFIQNNTGFSFQEHLNFLRLNHAVNLMMNSGLRLVDISLESGFSDPKYMNKAFHNVFGMTPRELRTKENWRELIQNQVDRGSTDLESYQQYLEPYL